MITKFNATISKKSKAVLAPLQEEEHDLPARVTYADGSTDVADDAEVQAEEEGRRPQLGATRPGLKKRAAFGPPFSF